MFGLLGNATLEMKLKEHFAPLGLGISITGGSINMASLRDWTRHLRPDAIQDVAAEHMTFGN